MIELCVQNDQICVYSASDWEKLRKEHRIIGVCLGNSSYTPTLPVSLLPEEVCLLINKKLAKLVQYPELKGAPTEVQLDAYKKFQKDLLQAEQALYKEIRRSELEQIIDKIVEGKRKKGQLQSRQEILKEELDKSCDVTESAMIWPILTEPLKSVQGKSVDVQLSKILEQTTPTRCAVYADLWEKGCYITPGIKFGGDFLVYLGEPVAFHAIYIVRCVEDIRTEYHTSEIVAFGRLGTSVKKKAVLASLSENGSVVYITLSWLDT